MKNIYRKFLSGVLVVSLVAFATGCNKFLDRPPLSDVTPDVYLKTEADLAAYTIGTYGTFPTHEGWGAGTFVSDNHTDNQANTGYATRWVPGEWRVPTSGGAWDFGGIRNINYFINRTGELSKTNQITGNSTNIQHYIGEGYFIRAFEYFKKLQALGDFPIVKEVLPDIMETLQAASVRKPRNEVARFILSDLDSAILLLSNTPPGGKNRITKQAAYLFKARVALYEGSWLTHHEGTAHVPGGPGWPGAASNPGFSINLAGEIDFFLGEAMAAASVIADAVPLRENTFDNGYYSAANPYFTMFAAHNMEPIPEVLMWRQYDSDNWGINHHVNQYINNTGANTGWTRGLVNSFLMTNGLPIYAPGSGWAGEDSSSYVRKNRDYRLALFTKLPGDKRFSDGAEHEGIPDIISQAAENRYVTGYAVKKGYSYDRNDSDRGQMGSEFGSIVFRAAEAYLIYLEASYLKNKRIDAKADKYWRALRRRAGVDENYQKTIEATVMTEEAKWDFGAYTKGQLVNATLYNIRRERRNELIAEGQRMSDLRRWRALDQLKTTPYIIEGFKLFAGMDEWYKDEDGDSRLIEAGGTATPNVSNSNESLFLRPYRINLGQGNLVKDGYKWAFAHYLDPIAINHFLITASNPDDPATSVIYQNPHWPAEANKGAIE